MFDPFRVEGQRVLVTGASSGLGRHFALTFARAGAAVALAARSTAKLADAAEEICGFGGRAVALALDVRDGASVREAVAKAVTDAGLADVFLNAKPLPEPPAQAPSGGNQAAPQGGSQPMETQPMGSELPAAAGQGERRLRVRVRGKDEIDRIEVVRNGRVIHRCFPVDAPLDEARRCLVRVEYGWGPWAGLSLERVCDWQLSLAVAGGRILSATPCFGTGPFDEDRRDRVLERSETACRWQSFTGRKAAFLDAPGKAMIFELEAHGDTQVRLDIEAPARRSVRRSLLELAQENVVEFTGGFPAESVLVHRPVLPEHYEAQFELADRGGPAADYYYVRVAQSNGQLAWSSPIWVG